MDKVRIGVLGIALLLGLIATFARVVELDRGVQWLISSADNGRVY
jgi:hypothetical protein